MDQGSGPTATPAEPDVEDGERPALKVALLLPEQPDVRQVRRAAELAATLMATRPTGGYQVSVAVGLPIADDRLWQAAEQRIRARAPEAIVRHLSWTRVPVDNALRMFPNLPESLDLEGIEEVSVPRDWGWNFTDCDCWISLAAPATGAIMPLKPVIHYVTDLAERFVPTAVAASIHDAYWHRQVEAFRLWRQGTVCTSDPDTVEDIVSYAGVRRSRIELIPDVLDGLPAIARADGGTEAVDRAPTLLWLQRGTALDDLYPAVQGLSGYLREGGRLNVVRVRDASHGVAEHQQAASLHPDLLGLWSQLPMQFYRSPSELDRMLARADAVWSSQIAGGEGEHVHDASRAALPLLAPAFPLNCREVARLNVTSFLYGLDDPLAITDSLHALERALAGARPGENPVRPELDAEERQAGFSFLLDRALEQIHAR